MELQLSNSLAALLGPELHGLAWLLTYSLHAAVWGSLVALVSKWQRLAPALRHAAWMSALLVPFVTTLLAFASAGSAKGAHATTWPGPHVAVV